MLSIPNQHHRVAIVGLGGVGTTQIALKYVYRIQDRTNRPSVFWVYASTRSRFEDSYLAIGRALGIPGVEAVGANAMQMVKDWLELDKLDSWLMVVDNADDVEIFFDNSISSLANFLPQSPRGSIIFTTRTSKAGSKLTRTDNIKIREMNTENSLKLLQENLSTNVQEDRKNATELLRVLDHLPLAIVQAASYINENDIKISDYLEIYSTSEETQVELLHEGFEDTARYADKENPIATTWLISFELVRKKDPLAADYLSFMWLAVIDKQFLDHCSLQTPLGRKL